MSRPPLALSGSLPVHEIVFRFPGRGDDLTVERWTFADGQMFVALRGGCTFDSWHDDNNPDAEHLTAICRGLGLNDAEIAEEVEIWARPDGGDQC